MKNDLVENVFTSPVRQHLIIDFAVQRDDGVWVSQIQRETLERLAVRYPDVKMMNYDEAASLHEEAFKSKPVEITREKFFDMLECLPPSQWVRRHNSESFKISAYQKMCRAAGIKVHPARFPAGFAEFFIKFLTDEGGTVFDMFAGSNTTGLVAETLGRRWIASELSEEYLEGSIFRFDSFAPKRASTAHKSK